MSRLVQFHLSTINPHSLRKQLSQIFADQPTVLSEGDSDLLLEEFVQYLTTISSKSSSLLCQQYAEVFEALKQESVPSRGVTDDDQLAQILVHIQEGNVESGEDENSEEESEDQSRDIDLMASDNEEDEEEIELENEKDRAFLDDEIQEQEDVSFYRRFHVELNRGLRQEQKQQRQELATYEDMLFGQEQTGDNKVLIQLEENWTPIYKNCQCWASILGSTTWMPPKNSCSRT